MGTVVAVPVVSDHDPRCDEPTMPYQVADMLAKMRRLEEIDRAVMFVEPARDPLDERGRDG